MNRSMIDGSSLSCPASAATVVHRHQKVFSGYRNLRRILSLVATAVLLGFCLYYLACLHHGAIQVFLLNQRKKKKGLLESNFYFPVTLHLACRKLPFIT